MHKIIHIISGGAEITNPDLTSVAAGIGIKARRVWGGACPSLSVESIIAGVIPQGVLSLLLEEGENYEMLRKPKNEGLRL